MIPVPSVAWPLNGVTSQQLTEALAASGFDLPALIGSVWHDKDSGSWLTDDDRELVHVVSAGNTVSGWQVSVVRYFDTGGPLKEVGHGVIYLSRLVAEFEHVQDGAA
ncbi:hypothetical protein [Catenuloplanes japonicus]|uniref:hypothetical protein n=1 Tax=Catenuloplanes japonicus TaxID=33876 RepID=UPI0005258C9D|nr:hypothetical protein [Catenuloplanes japonicus]